jgi:hypothetical protein
MAQLPDPTAEENEAFEAISRTQEEHLKSLSEPWIWLPAGQYTPTQLQQLLNSFGKMKKAVEG